MFDKIKKTMTLVVGALALATAGLNAQGWNYNHNDNSNCCYTNNDCCYDPCNSCCLGDITFEVDFLYWEDLDQPFTGYKRLQDGFTGGAVFVEEELFTDKVGSPGVRLKFNYFMDCLCTNFGLYWTHIKRDGTTHYHTDREGEFISSTSNNPTLLLEGYSVYFEDRLDYLDFDFSRSFKPHCCFTVTPHVGVRLLWDKAKFRCEGEGYSQGNTPVPPGPLYEHCKQHSGIDSYGIEGGLWLQWDLNCGLSLIGHFGGSALRTKFDAKYEEHNEIEVSVETFYDAIFIGKTDNCYITDTFDYFIGVQYDFCLCDREMSFKLGWEHFHENGDYNLEYGFHGLTTGLAAKF